MCRIKRFFFNTLIFGFHKFLQGILVKNNGEILARVLDVFLKHYRKKMWTIVDEILEELFQIVTLGTARRAPMESNVAILEKFP